MAQAQVQYSANNDRLPRAPFKMAGGKTQLLHEILPRLPRQINRYFEPFIGGGAVFFELARTQRFDFACINDANADLMCAYKILQCEPERLIKKLGEYCNTEEFFYATRAKEPKSDLEQAARFIYLNKSCFNGLFRVNKSGKFNVPFGHYKNPTICDADNLRACGLVLKNWKVKIDNVDFEVSLKTASKGDVAYCDSPYVPRNLSSDFTKYTADGFGEQDQERLAKCAATLRSRGVKILLSNADVPLVHKLYKGFKIEQVFARRNINSDGDARGKITELLISANL